MNLSKAAEALVGQLIFISRPIRCSCMATVFCVASGVKDNWICPLCDSRFVREFQVAMDPRDGFDLATAHDYNFQPDPMTGRWMVDEDMSELIVMLGPNACAECGRGQNSCSCRI